MFLWENMPSGRLNISPCEPLSSIVNRGCSEVSLMWLYSFARRLEMCLHDNKHPDNLLLSPLSLSLLLLLLLKIVLITQLLQVSHFDTPAGYF